MATFSKHDVKRYPDLFSKSEKSVINSRLSQAAWSYGHGSHPVGDPNRKGSFWMMDLRSDPFFTEYLLNIIEETTEQKYELNSVYCNGHTFGTSGDFHKDWDDEPGRTFLYYVNDSWKQDWNGKTVFKFNDKYHYSEFIPNSGILFPGVIPHKAEGTSRSFLDLRKTIAWKLVLK